MPNHSNAITDALRRLYLSEQMGLRADFAIGQAKLALYEAVNLQLPLPILKDDEDLVSTPYRVGYNKALDDVLTNLNVSFGISKEGEKAMYNNKTIEDVLKYLYEVKKDDLAKPVLELIKRCERAEATPQYPTNQPPMQPQIWYGDGVNPPYKITS